MEGAIDALDFLDTRQFQIAVKRLADSLSYGTDHSPYLGSGIEYVQSRPYEPGDSVRSIDWRVTARTGRVFVKEYESPKRMPVYFLIDTSASMAVSSRERSKYATALLLAGGLALACLDRVSPVGVIGGGTRRIHVRPSLSKPQVLEWILRLRHFRYDEETLLSKRIAELTPSLTQRTLFIVLSDLHEPACLPALRRLAQLHDCAVLQLVDPAESELHGAGFLRAREAETGQEFWSHGRRAHLPGDAVARSLRGSGIDRLVLRTDGEHAHSLRAFFETRGLLGRMAR